MATLEEMQASFRAAERAHDKRLSNATKNYGEELGAALVTYLNVEGNYEDPEMIAARSQLAELLADMNTPEKVLVMLQIIETRVMQLQRNYRINQPKVS